MTIWSTHSCASCIRPRTVWYTYRVETSWCIVKTKWFCNGLRQSMTGCKSVLIAIFSGNAYFSVATNSIRGRKFYCVNKRFHTLSHARLGMWSPYDYRISLAIVHTDPWGSLFSMYKYGQRRPLTLSQLHNISCPYFVLIIFRSFVSEDIFSMTPNESVGYPTKSIQFEV